jgi:hypothetical protein
MFWTVFPSIIRSSRLYTQHQVYVIQKLASSQLTCMTYTWCTERPSEACRVIFNKLERGHETEPSSISWPLASSQLTCMTYTWCCLYSLELLMMDRKTETRRVISNKLENCASVWFYYRNKYLLLEKPTCSENSWNLPLHCLKSNWIPFNIREK